MMFGVFDVLAVHDETTLVITPRVQALLHVFTQVNVLHVQGMTEPVHESFFLGAGLSEQVEVVSHPGPFRCQGENLEHDEIWGAGIKQRYQVGPDIAE